MIGQIYTTNNFGDVLVLSKGDKYNYYRVKFLNTANIDEFRKDAILNGCITDRYAPTYCGVGIIGNVSTKRDNSRKYKVWANMLSRCYNENNIEYNAYGGRGIIVCSEWLTFEYFLNDIQYIENWNEEEFNNGNLELDKDIKQSFQKENKIYSKQTCMWLNKEINNKNQHSQQRKFKAIAPNGEIFLDYNIADFARKHNLERRQISAVLHGRFKSHLGWKFIFDDK